MWAWAFAVLISLPIDPIGPLREGLSIGAPRLNSTALIERVEFLKSFSLFAELSTSELEVLCQFMQPLELKAGSILLTQNQPAEAVYFLRSGTVKILVNGEMVAQLDKPQCFGEMSCLTPDTPASASVITACSSQLYRISKDDFLFSANQITKLWKLLFFQLSDRLRTLNGRLSEVLNHLPHGLVKVAPGGQITNDYSLSCAKIFKQDNIAGYTFASLAFPNDPNKQKSWTENFGLLFADTNMSFESCATLLATEFTLSCDANLKSYAMKYSPCRDSSGRTVAVDIGIEDVTKQKELEAKHREIKLKQEVHSKVTQSPDSFMNFLSMCDEVYADYHDFLTQLSLSTVDVVRPRIEQTMRGLHSLKGMSGVFSLQNLKLVVHDAETLISRLKDDTSPDLCKELQAKQHQFRKEVQNAHAIFSEMPAELRRRLLGNVLSQDEFDSLKAMIENTQHADLNRVLASIEKVDAKKLFANWSAEAKKIATALGKQVLLSTSGEGGRISKDLFTKLDKVLIHLLRNALDHGLETPNDRAAKGKPSLGRVTAMVNITETELLIVIEDDGRGINSEALATRARQNKKLNQTLVDQFVRQGEEWRILLLPGFSTAEQVTEISGRGVGLDAVASAVSELGGTLSIESRFGEGTCFLISASLNSKSSSRR